ncbi:uncharacterized protein E0L32_002560 [Thyridium curvatum]|uniref:DUF1275 domain-containing protein n=1 Tax=Thyridium curvatum TaxID=1093900 RepID=A0A507BGT1_9PEZI|nr:uncharacterized protein E0L32_002560 [Thyridium curvatum]TPX18703.1 hypothetical protein E0L32_002560 [Thyridium curvatum]
MGARLNTLREYLQDSVQDGEEERVFVDIELLALSFATGIQDAISYPDYHCFASNQTGNTVLLALAAADVGTDLFNTANTCLSLGVFLGGCFTMGQIGNAVGARKRWWLVLTNLFSTALMFVAAGIQYAMPVDVSGPRALGVITLLAFSSAAQVAMARPLNVPQITTVSRE